MDVFIFYPKYRVEETILKQGVDFNHIFNKNNLNTTDMQVTSLLNLLTIFNQC